MENSQITWKDCNELAECMSDIKIATAKATYILDTSIEKYADTFLYNRENTVTERTLLAHGYDETSAYIEIARDYCFINLELIKQAENLLDVFFKKSKAIKERA